jgi:hypothetical protein
LFRIHKRSAIRESRGKLIKHADAGNYPSAGRFDFVRKAWRVASAVRICGSP